MIPKRVAGLQSVNGHAVENGTLLYLNLGNNDGQEFHTVINSHGMNELLGALLRSGQDIAAHVSVPSERVRSMTVAHHISIAELGISPGLSPDEVILAAQFGISTITFSVKKETLQSVCLTLHQIDKAAPPRRSN